MRIAPKKVVYSLPMQESLDKNLIDWAMEKRRFLGLKIFEVKWRGLAVYDYAVKLHLEENEFEGRGTALSSMKALAIALTEAFERYCAYQNEISSTIGISAHSSEGSAVQNAYDEFIERYNVSFHLDRDLPFRQLESVLDSKMSVYTNNGFQFQFGESIETNNISTKIVKVNHEQFFDDFLLFSDVNLSEQSLLKVLRNIEAIMANRRVDHFDWYYSNSFSDKFCLSLEVLNQEYSRPLNISMKKLSCNISVPLFFTQAHEDDLMVVQNRLRGVSHAI